MGGYAGFRYGAWNLLAELLTILQHGSSSVGCCLYAVVQYIIKSQCSLILKVAYAAGLGEDERTSIQLQLTRARRAFQYIARWWSGSSLLYIYLYSLTMLLGICRKIGMPPGLLPLLGAADHPSTSVVAVLSRCSVCPLHLELGSRCLCSEEKQIQESKPRHPRPGLQTQESGACKCPGDPKSDSQGGPWEQGRQKSGCLLGSQSKKTDEHRVNNNKISIKVNE